MPTRLLLVADAGCDTADDALPDPVRDAVAEATHVTVVAPVIGSRLDTIAGDQSIWDDAAERAERLAAGVRSHGTDARSVRSESGPLEAALAELRTDEYDGVLLALTSQDHWREEGVVDQLRDATELPVSAVEVG